MTPYSAGTRTPGERNVDGGNGMRQLARELADQADREQAAHHPQLARAFAELGLTYVEMSTYAPHGPHGAAAWQAAEDARISLVDGTAVGASADIARARLHLALDKLAAQDLQRP